MQNGILLIAQGSQAYYNAASNLIASIRVKDPQGRAGCDLPIHLICDDPNKAAHLKGIVTIQTIEDGDNVPFYTKTLLYKYSPFDASLYIDADSLCIGDPSRIFEDFTDNFYSIVVSKADYQSANAVKMLWANPRKVWDHYEIKPAYRMFNELQNSAILFRKSQEAKDIFTLAEYFYAANPYPEFRGLAHGRDANRGLGHYPDELAFEVALLSIGKDLDSKFDPISWPNGPFSWTTLGKGWPFISLPGGAGNVHREVWRQYSQLSTRWARLAAQQLTGSPAGAYNMGRGFSFTEQDKAANTAPRFRYDGLRQQTKAERKKILRILDKYNQKGGQDEKEE